MLLELLKKRYSCRNFLNKEISNEIINYILECARLSASGGNDQPWKFGVITNSEIIQKISVAANINYEQKWVASAPLVIVLCTKILHKVDYVDVPWEQLHSVGLNRFPSMKDKILELDKDLYVIINMEEHQTKIPGEHMVLAALEHGIYSTWISSIDCERVGELVGIENYLVTNVIAFGYPGESKEVTTKKHLKDITFINHFDNKYDI